MKKYILLILLAYNSVFSQSRGIITYDIGFNLTIEKIDERIRKMKKKPNKELIQALKERVRNSTKLEGVLTFSGTVSNYKLSNSLSNEVNGEGMKLLKSSSGGENLYWVSMIKNECKAQDCKTLDECFVINKESLEWELIQETKIVGDYLCYKAININSKNKIKKTVAWYTPDIPLSFGPKYYHGLPGLILEIEEAAITIRAKKIKLNPEENIPLKSSILGKEVSEKKFKEILLKSFPELYK